MGRMMRAVYVMRVLERRGWVVFPMRGALFLMLYVSIQCYYIMQDPLGLGVGLNRVLGAVFAGSAVFCGAGLYWVCLELGKGARLMLGEYMKGVEEEARRLEAGRAELLEMERLQGGALTLADNDDDDDEQTKRGAKR